MRPDSPSSAVAITGTYVPQPDSGQELSHSQVFETTDDGVSWARLGDPHRSRARRDDRRRHQDRSRTASTCPARAGTARQRTASLFVSKDKGRAGANVRLPAAQFDPTTEDDDLHRRRRSHQRRSPLPPLERPGDGRAFAPHGRDARGRRDADLLDAPISSTPMHGVPRYHGRDARVRALAGRIEGLHREPGRRALGRADSSDLSFKKTSSISVQCLATRGPSSGLARPP